MPMKTNHIFVRITADKGQCSKSFLPEMTHTWLFPIFIVVRRNVPNKNLHGFSASPEWNETLHSNKQHKSTISRTNDSKLTTSRLFGVVSKPLLYSQKYSNVYYTSFSLVRYASLIILNCVFNTTNTCLTRKLKDRSKWDFVCPKYS